MKLHYYPETDSLYIELRAEAGAETREVAPGVNADFGADGMIIGFDIDATRKLNLSTLEAIDVPLSALKAARAIDVAMGASRVGRASIRAGRRRCPTLTFLAS
jgi:uncharacterized protein YuzE